MSNKLAITTDGKHQLGNKAYLTVDGKHQKIRKMYKTVNGKHELVDMKINPEAVDPDDVEMLQDMIIAAVNEAMRAADAEASQNMARLTGGMNLGGLF